MEPLKINDIIPKDLEKELEKIRKAIRGVGDESYTSFSRLANESHQAQVGMSADTQKYALLISQSIQLLRQNEKAQAGLIEKLKEGSITSKEYAQTQRELVTLQADLKVQISRLNRELERYIELQDKIARMPESAFPGVSKSSGSASGPAPVTGSGTLKTSSTSSGHQGKGSRSIPRADAGPLDEAVMAVGGKIGEAILKSFPGLAKYWRGGSQSRTDEVHKAILTRQASTSNFQTASTFFAETFRDLLKGNGAELRKKLDVIWNDDISLWGAWREMKEAASRQVDFNKQQAQNVNLIRGNDLVIREAVKKYNSSHTSAEEKGALLNDVVLRVEDNRNIELGELKELYEIFKGLNPVDFHLAKTERSAFAMEKLEGYFYRMAQGETFSATEQNQMLGLMNELENVLDLGTGLAGEKRTEYMSFFDAMITLSKLYADELENLGKHLDLFDSPSNFTHSQEPATSLAAVEGKGITVSGFHTGSSGNVPETFGEEITLLEQTLAEARELRQADLEEQLVEYQNFTTQKSSLINSFEQDKKQLLKAYGEAATEEEKNRIAEALKCWEEMQEALMTENSDFSPELFDGLEEASRKEFQKVLKQVKVFIQKLRQEGNPGDEMGDMLDDLENRIDSFSADGGKKKGPGLEDYFRGASTALRECAETASYFSEGLAGALEVASEIAGAAGDIAGGIAGMATNPLQGTLQLVTGISSLIGSFAKRKQENARIREEHRQYQIEMYSKELEYNSILRDRLRIQQQLGETSMQYFNRMKEELKKQSGEINKEYEAVWGKLMGEEYISGQGYKHGTLFRKAKTWNEYGSLGGKTYEEIEKLYTQDKLEGSAKELFERLKQLKEEGANVVEMMEQLQEEVKQAWTGTTADSITDSIVQGFLDGKRSAEDFADDFEAMMRKAMMQSIKMKYLEGPLNEWYHQFADASENGLSESKIQQLREQYNQIIQDAARHAEEMERVTGISISDANSVTSDNSLSGAYAKASQESIDLLAGQTGALRINVENIHNRMMDLYDLQVQGWNDVMEIKNSVHQIERYSKVTKEAVDRMSLHGVKINMN